MHLRKWLLDRNPDLPLPLLQVREAADAALSTYVPRFYPGKVTFLKAACRDEEFPDDPQTIWGQLVQDLELYTVPGGHRTLVTEYSDAIASRLTACIVETRRQRAREFPARPNIVRSFGIATDNRLEVQAV
jgi:thioesterase domain-containing protein